MVTVIATFLACLVQHEAKGALILRIGRMQPQRAGGSVRCALALHTAAAARLLRPSVQQELEESIAAEPERHPLIPGTGGFRKARWRRPGYGKSGGVRVIYYFMVRPDLVFLADLYARNEKENPTHAERNQLQKIASEIKQEFGG